MRALTYHGAKDVRIETAPDPILQEADNIIPEVTATAIYGSGPASVSIQNSGRRA